MQVVSMRLPSSPDGYDTSKVVQTGRPNCAITVGFDRIRGHIPKFLVQFHYQVSNAPLQWEPIARIDHNEKPGKGHNVYNEGLHVDIDRRTLPEVKLYIRHTPLPKSRGAVISKSVDYFRTHADYFIDVFEENRLAGTPPKWPDGGVQAPKLNCSENVEDIMSKGSPAEEALSLDELNETLAAAENTTVEEIEREAESMEFAPPEEGEVVIADEQDE